jgi:hypothetical protein
LRTVGRWGLLLLLLLLLKKKAVIVPALPLPFPPPPPCVGGKRRSGARRSRGRVEGERRRERASLPACLPACLLACSRSGPTGRATRAVPVCVACACVWAAGRRLCCCCFVSITHACIMRKLMRIIDARPTGETVIGYTPHQHQASRRKPHTHCSQPPTRDIYHCGPHHKQGGSLVPAGGARGFLPPVLLLCEGRNVGEPGGVFEGRRYVPMILIDSGFCEKSSCVPAADLDRRTLGPQDLEVAAKKHTLDRLIR